VGGRAISEVIVVVIVRGVCWFGWRGRVLEAPEADAAAEEGDDSDEDEGFFFGGSCHGHNLWPMAGSSAQQNVTGGI
jgi:hypothetical protein